MHYSYKNNIEEKTEVVNGKEATTDRLLHLVSTSQMRMDICGDSMSPSVAVGVEVFKQALIDAKARGVRIRYVVEITRDNIQQCKELMKIVSELRHLNGANGNFLVSDTEYVVSGASLLREQQLPQAVYSTVRTIVKQNQYLFDTLWNNARSAGQRIKEIEEGIEPVKIEIIHDPIFSREVFKQLIKSADEEIMLVLPTVRDFIRHEKLGTMQLLMEAASRRGIKVRIMMVKHKSIENSAESLKRHQQQHDFLVDVRFIKKEEWSFNKAESLLIDKKTLLVAEIKDDSKDDFVEAIGFSTYSNSYAGILAYISMFEDLWMQSQLYEQLVEAVKQLASANEQLEIQGKMQQEFINIAAHELRTPIQPILGAIDIIRLRQSATMQQQEKGGAMAEVPGATNEEIEIIFRNAMRLERLSKDILDVTLIESGSLRLNKETFDLNQKVRNVAADMQGTHLVAKKDKLKIRVETSGEPLMVTADKQRIFEVISNLMTNAIKFTEQGSITITAGTKDGAPSVTVKDTGSGIDSEIMPRLFEKFATKSDQVEQGTGLGLYISKKIIEAHGGRIWGENNPDGKGATFTFTLPLDR
ncbi:MAG: signal transduction histidine kinase [Candidatus Nitrosomirales archaeon]|jgi:signal transduction histidine kinase